MEAWLPGKNESGKTVLTRNGLAISYRDISRVTLSRRIGKPKATNNSLISIGSS